MCFYPMFLNNELVQYSCLISDRRVLQNPAVESEEDGEDKYDVGMLQVKEKVKSAVIVPKTMDKAQSVPMDIGEGILTANRSAIVTKA